MENLTRFLAALSVLGIGSSSASALNAGWFQARRAATTGEAPTATIRNGTYEGLYSATYKQDFFLGMPYAQAPVEDLRLRISQGLDIAWTGTRDAKAYYPHCVGYGGDQTGYVQSEDCLALNVIRPAGYENESLPVAVWIHGGGYVMGGTPDRRYNLSFIVENSVAISKPIVAVSIAYRLSGWGFLDSQEVRNAGITNLGIRDQRLALQWIQENIAAFGGDASKVTIWGESAGAGSVGIHLTAYNGRDDKLFSKAVGESGSPLLLGVSRYDVSQGQAKYNNISAAAGCAGSFDTLACLRSASFDILNQALNITPSYTFLPYADEDLIQGYQSDQLMNGNFIKVPYLIGTNADEGSAFGEMGINSDTEFEAYLNSTGVDYNTAKTLEIVYPNIPALGVLETVTYTPDAVYGSQFKRSAAFGGDLNFIAGRRLTSQQWAAYNVSAYAYRFNVIVNPLPPIIGVTHFQEVAFVFNNLQGLGYAANPFQGEPASFAALSKLMSCAWVAFVHDGDPNGHSQGGIPEWPRYDNGVGGYGQDFVFDANVTSHPEPDTFRGVAIAYMNTLWKTQFGK